MHKKDKGPSKHLQIEKMHKESKLERIIKLIRKGTSYMEILDSFPTMSKHILSHMHLRPGRKEKTIEIQRRTSACQEGIVLMNQLVIKLPFICRQRYEDR